MGMRQFTDSYRPGCQGHHCSKLRKTHGERVRKMICQWWANTTSNCKCSPWWATINWRPIIGSNGWFCRARITRAKRYQAAAIDQWFTMIYYFSYVLFCFLSHFFVFWKSTPQGHDRRVGWYVQCRAEQPGSWHLDQRWHRLSLPETAELLVRGHGDDQLMIIDDHW